MNHFWTRRQTLWMLTGTAAGLALHACTPNQPRSPETSDKNTASIGLFTWVGSTPLYIAKEKGFFDDLGLDLDVKVFSANTDANTAFIANRLDAVSPVASEAVTLAATGKDFRIVLVQDTSVGGDGILARNSIAEIADFKGERIAVEEGSVSHFFLLQVLDTVGLDSEDFTLVNAPPDAAAAAYQSGNIPIAVTYAPYLQKANEAQSDGRIIYDSSQMPTAITDLYVFDAAFSDRHPETVLAFVQGVLQGLEFLRTNREEGIAIAAQQLDIPPEELASALNGVRLPDLQANLELLANPQSDRYLLNSMQSLAQFLKAQGQIQQVPDLAPLIEPKFILRIDSV
ncbi:ABC transporter substrate-binding protein [Phormidium sp. CCY1219]|uniref:ABC transporter substrate-binding protein n=1 Tax=Phormidium sp. CCY1219 TaxID=2886104 RepID=UPI002D1E731D|nr:ABC transporter substrate-binding protein [Phormidium sp. CCY1219]MEB3831097.1 ABC transporter substrate-binding protein [Phormidium sp. CCY1219]